MCHSTAEPYAPVFFCSFWLILFLEVRFFLETSQKPESVFVCIIIKTNIGVLFCPNIIPKEQIFMIYWEHT